MSFYPVYYLVEIFSPKDFLLYASYNKQTSVQERTLWHDSLPGTSFRRNTASSWSLLSIARASSSGYFSENGNSDKCSLSLCYRQLVGHLSCSSVTVGPRMSEFLQTRRV